MKLPHEEAIRLIAEYQQTGSEAARNRLIEAYQPMIRDIAQSVRQHLVDRVDVDDLIQVGTFGLIHAIKGFDPARKVRFRTYANHRVRGEMLDFVRSMDSVPRLTRQRCRMMAGVEQAYLAEQGRLPTNDELQEALGVDDREFHLISREREREYVSLDRPIARTEHGTVLTHAEVLEDEKAKDLSIRAEADDLMNYVLRTYGVSAALMLRLRFWDGWTIAQIGEALGGVCQSAIFIRFSQLRRHLQATVGRAA